MTLCVIDKGHCMCQPDEGVFCPNYKPDAYVQCLMDAITELLKEREASDPWNLICPKCGAAKGEECCWPSNCPTGQNRSNAAPDMAAPHKEKP